MFLFACQGMSRRRGLLWAFGGCGWTQGKFNVGGLPWGSSWLDSIAIELQVLGRGIGRHIGRNMCLNTGNIRFKREGKSQDSSSDRVIWRFDIKKLRT